MGSHENSPLPYHKAQRKILSIDDLRFGGRSAKATHEPELEPELRQR